MVSSVDLSRYAGKWYEIASYPAFFQAGCTGTTAEYTLREDGTVTVLNTCSKGSLDGPVDQIVGKARVPDPANPAKLKVSALLNPRPLAVRPEELRSDAACTKPLGRIRFSFREGPVGQKGEPELCMNGKACPTCGGNASITW